MSYIFPTMPAVLSVLFLSAPALCSDASLTLPLEVQTALQRNAELMDPVAIAWTEITVRSEHRGWKHNWRVVWMNKHLYVSEQNIEPKPGPLNETAFDGDIISDRIAKGVSGKQFARELQQPISIGNYFENVGMTVPLTSTDLLDGRAHSLLLPKLLAGPIISITPVRLDGRDLLQINLTVENLIRARAMQVNIENAIKEARRRAKTERDIAVLRSDLIQRQQMDPFFVESVYLDPSMNYALVRIDDRNRNGRWIQRRINSDFKRLPGRDLWLPTKLSNETFWESGPQDGFSIADVPLRTDSILVSSIDPKPDANTSFSLKFDTPGTIVIDKTASKVGRTYEVPLPPGPSDLTQWYRRPRTVVVLLNILVIVISGIFFLRTRRAKSIR